MVQKESSISIFHWLPIDILYVSKQYGTKSSIKYIKFITISQLQHKTSRSDIEFFFKVLEKMNLVDAIKQKEHLHPKYFSYKSQAAFVTMFPKNNFFFRQISKFIMLSWYGLKITKISNWNIKRKKHYELAGNKVEKNVYIWIRGAHQHG